MSDTHFIQEIAADEQARLDDSPKHPVDEDVADRISKIVKMCLRRGCATKEKLTEAVLIIYVQQWGILPANELDVSVANIRSVIGTMLDQQTIQEERHLSLL